MDIVKFTIGLKKLNKAKDKMIEDILSKYGISMFHVQYLFVINDLNDDATLKDLSEILEINKSNTSRAILKLLTKGFVRKTNTEKKLRGYSLVLTESGLNVVSEITNSFNEVFEELINPFENKEDQLKFKMLIQNLVFKYYEEEL